MGFCVCLGRYHDLITDPHKGLTTCQFTLHNIMRQITQQVASGGWNCWLKRADPSLLNPTKLDFINCAVKPGNQAPGCLGTEVQLKGFQLCFRANSSSCHFIPLMLGGKGIKLHASCKAPLKSSGGLRSPLTAQRHRCSSAHPMFPTTGC